VGTEAMSLTPAGTRRSSAVFVAPRLKMWPPGYLASNRRPSPALCQCGGMVPGSSAARPGTWMGVPAGWRVRWTRRGPDQGFVATRSSRVSAASACSSSGRWCCAARKAAISAGWAHVVRFGVAGAGFRGPLRGCQRAVRLGNLTVRAASNQLRTIAGATPNCASEGVGVGRREEDRDVGPVGIVGGRERTRQGRVGASLIGWRRCRPPRWPPPRQRRRSFQPASPQGAQRGGYAREAVGRDAPAARGDSGPRCWTGLPQSPSLAQPCARLKAPGAGQGPRTLRLRRCPFELAAWSAAVAGRTAARLACSRRCRRPGRSAAHPDRAARLRLQQSQRGHARRR
jgi:hypothetical protein